MRTLPEPGGLQVEAERPQEVQRRLDSNFCQPWYRPGKENALVGQVTPQKTRWDISSPCKDQ